MVASYTDEPIAVPSAAPANGSDEVVLGPRLTELGNAERLVAMHGSDLRYSKARGWLVWDGSRWTFDDTGEIDRRAKETIKSLWQEGAAHDEPTIRDAILAHARRSEKASAIQAAIKLAASEPGIAIAAKDLDCDPWILNCPNGVVDLRTGTLRPHDRRDLCTKLAGASFDPSATCPRWDQFLAEVQPDPAMRAFLQRLAGYVATGVIRERVFVLLIGSGKNGKSVFVKVLVKLLGDYAIYAAPDVLMAKERGDRHPTELADLCGARLAAMSEIRAGRAFDEETLKRLTGNEPIKARYMRQDFFEFDMTAKLLMAANHRPTVQDTTNSIWDRLREVPFTVRIDEANEDRALYERLCGELPGILNWCVQGCVAWQRDGLGAPPAVVQATAAYREAEDWLAAFFSECVVVESTALAPRSQLRAAYEAWCRTSGEKAVDSKTFTAAVRERATERKVGGMRLWRGIRLRVESDDRREGAAHVGH